MGMSLWLVPAAAQMDAIKSCLPPRPQSIDQPLSPSSFPTIIPHITLATVPFSDGILDVLSDAVPEGQKPIRVNFQSLVVGDHYFRSVFIDIRPTQELVDLQDQVVTSLRRRGLEPSAPRFPHMSLCYIADEDQSERDRTAQRLNDAGVVSQTAGSQSISLRCGEVGLSGFDAVEIWVVKCDGRVEAWEVNKRLELTPA